MASPKPLTSRPMDLAYFIFFLIHIPASLLMDFQTLYPKGLLPDAIAAIPHWYFERSGDPLIGGALGYLGDKPELAWFKIFLWLELLFQFPTFFIGAYGLWKDSKSVWVLILVYGASTATTTLACLSIFITTPVTSVDEMKVPGSVTPEQMGMLMQSYIPFFLVPLVMSVDMAFRCQKLVAEAVRMGEGAKRK